MHEPSKYEMRYYVSRGKLLNVVSNVVINYLFYLVEKQVTKLFSVHVLYVRECNNIIREEPMNKRNRSQRHLNFFVVVSQLKY